jgi:hypothetical protein
MAVEALDNERILIEETAPEPSTAAQVAGELVGSFILSVRGHHWPPCCGRTKTCHSPPSPL